MIGTRFVEDEPTLEVLRGEHAGYEHFLEHDPIATIVHPSEWCVSMLADAATHTLELQARLLGAGFSLKDATAYNIQFVDGRPIFIDLPSIERPTRLDVWFGLGQFSQMFLFPLLLATRKGWDLRSYFLGRSKRPRPRTGCAIIRWPGAPQALRSAGPDAASFPEPPRERETDHWRTKAAGAA